MSARERYRASDLPTGTDDEREAAIAAASRAVQRGELVVLPTDTVYGIGADAFDPAAVRGCSTPRAAAARCRRRCWSARRPRSTPWRPGCPGYARALVEEFWPGPLTLVCRQQASLQWDLGDTRGTVAVRMPDHEVALELLERTGPLAVSSRQPTGRPAATDADAAEEMLGEDVAVIIDAGPRPGARPPRSSTSPATRARVLRRGALSLERPQRRARAARGHPDRRGLSRRVREYLLVFLVAAAVTYLLTVIAREIALRTGAVAQVRDRDVHAEPIPYLGGLAMLGGLGGGVPRGPAAAVPLPQRPFVFRDAGVVLIAGALICAVGVLDDLFELDALTKLGGQVLAAGFLIVFGIQFVFFPLPGGEPVLPRPGPGGAAHRRARGRRRSTRSTSSTGSTASPPGVVGIGAVGVLPVLLPARRPQRRSRWRPPARCCARRSAGACAGFLPHNFHPARLFMGDSGSMLIGLVLSARALTLTGQFAGTDISQRRQPAPTPACCRRCCRCCCRSRS